MASRAWGGAWASFYELDNIVSGMPVSYGGVNQFNSIVDNSAEWRRVLSGIGSGRVTLYAVNNWEQFVVPGRVCIVHKNVSGYAAIVSRLITCFLIENVEPGVRGGLNVVTLSGPGVESLLTKRPVFGPVGQETIYSTTLAAAADAPRTSSLNDPAAEGSDVAVIVDDTGIDKDDEIRIRLGAANDGDWHVAYVTQVNPPDTAAGTIQFSPAQPAAAAEGNSVEIRTAGLSLASVANLAVGHRVEITLDNATVFETTIRRIDSPLSAIFIQEGLTSIASSGKAVAAYDYSGLATDDVTQIMQHAPGWTMTFETGNGTAIGTAHAPADESVFDLLSSTAERTGEMFRYRVLAAGLPTYRLDWRRTPDDSGVYFIMYAPDEHDRQLADEDDIGKASIKSLKSRRSRRLITRVYPKPGDGVISLRYCTPQAVTNAIVDGFGIYVSDDFYEPDYVELTADVAEYGVHAITENYSDISVVVGNPHGLTAAADQLLASAIQTLYQAASQFEFTIEAYSPSLIHPGQFVHIENETGTEPASDAVNTFTVLETTEKLVDGRPHTTLIVANHTNYRRTPAAAVATLIRSLRQTQRRISARAAGEGTTTIVTGGGGGGGGGDHGALTGLTDDDHPQYLRTDGSRTLTGNLAANAGVMVDGVDISSHVANPSAHHAPVTAQDASLSINGQAVGIRLSPLPAGLNIRTTPGGEGLAVYLNQAGSGLELTASGLSIADAIAGDGLKVAAKTLHVDIPVSGGLTIINGQLSLGSPGQLSVNSVGGISGNSHTHSIFSSANPGAATQLLKTDTNGYLQLLAMAIGTTPDGASALKITPPGAAWSGLLLKQRSDQISPLLRIENAAGGALLIVTNTGDLESGTPGFVSGLRGWQIASPGNVEFNNAKIRGELHASTFVADEMHALGGTLLAASSTTVGEPSGIYNNAMKAVDTTATTYLVVNASYATGLCYFAAKDVVRIQSLGQASGGGLYVPDIYLEVSSVISLNDRDMAHGKPGRHVLACVRKSGGYTNYVVPTGAAVVKWTRTGQGVGAYKGQLLITADLSLSPYIDIFTVDASLASLSPWPGSGDLRTPPAIKPRVRLGNLDGVLGLAEQWGIAAGTDLSDTTATAPHIIASNLSVTLKNIDLSMWSGIDRIVHISPAGIALLNGTTQFINDRSIRWNKSNGVTVGALAVRESAGVRYLELGLSPSFGFDTMSENGIRVVHNTAASYGAATHDFNIWGHGRIQIVAGAQVDISSGTFTRAGNLRLTAGLTVGDANTDAPAAAVRLKTRAALGTPPVGFADFYLTTNLSGIDELYIRFAGRPAIKLA